VGTGPIKVIGVSEVVAQVRDVAARSSTARTPR
jgi:hypothetical protein